MINYYSLLGTERNATKKEIKKNYRLLATKYHPDKSKDPDSATKFIAITEAYDTLSNKKSRAKYDLLIWEELKRKKDSTEYFNIAITPPETTRTRRNKAQQKRSLLYHQESSLNKKQLKLVMESFHVFGRYILHVFGLILLFVIVNSAIGHVSPSFAKGLLPGVIICVFIGVISYAIIWTVKNFFYNLILDLEAFSVFYKIPQKRAALISMFLFTFILLLCIIILKAFL